MTAVLEPVIQSPKLPLYVAELERLLEAERQARSRFRDELDPSVKAEFINGSCILHSPATYRHTNVTHLLHRLLSAYVDRQQLGWVGGEKVLVCLARNDYEPDLVFYGREKAAQLQPQQRQFPPPDLVVEVLSETTERCDRGVKFEDYAAHGIREYWVVDPDAETVEQYELSGEGYSLRLKQGGRTLQSVVGPGFAVPVRALFDREENLPWLQQLAA